ncbi:hypothetical protein BRADI_1g49930v3 [Brachypodium distachyon]|uniref:KIB1-4 beta-propeller domain-containing protein n=1 Tax=Brachypodium distachyon TaxID=15368 RepID=I1H184_BRADI|nr:hypothetical protein BRADI_1g49930v3 [Brachypodium distachyon]
MGLFNGGSDEPSKTDLSPPPPTTVAPRSEQPTKSFSASLPADPLKKRGPLDIDQIDVLETGSTKLPETNLLPLAPEVIVPREVVVTDRPSKKICHASGSSSASSGRHVWADLTGFLLQEIMFLFSSFHDILAVTGTCRSWRAAVSSFPSINTFTIPPLHLKPAPRNTPTYMRCLGCSYGHLIFSNVHFLLVDVYTCTKVKAPKLQANSNNVVYYGIFLAPLGSPNSCLLLCSRTSMFQWKVRTNSWTEYPFVAPSTSSFKYDGRSILQIVFFKGQMFAMDSLHRLNTISLEPQLSMREVVVPWGNDVVFKYDPWLVVCGDMLLMVILTLLNHPFHVLRLDFSAEPAKWVMMEKLENWALFLSLDRRCPTFSCMSPERWGGKSNRIYVPNASEDSDKPWIEVQLGQRVPSTTLSISNGLHGISNQLESLWVLPSLVYGVGQ